MLSSARETLSVLCRKSLEHMMLYQNVKRYLSLPSIIVPAGEATPERRESSKLTVSHSFGKESF